MLRSISAVTAAFIAVFCSGSAHAQTAPVFNWTGFYYGWDIGRTVGDNEFRITGAANPNPDTYSFGLHGGYRIQYANNFVFGWEVNASLLPWGGSGDFFDGSTTTSGGIKFTWDASARLVLGRAFGRSLIYVTGGIVALDFDGCGGTTVIQGRWRRVRRSVDCIPGSEMDDIRIGLTTGFGLAHAVTDRFVMRVEYLFTDYGTERYVTPASVTNFTDVSLSTHAVRFGFTYLFGR